MQASPHGGRWLRFDAKTPKIQPSGKTLKAVGILSFVITKTVFVRIVGMSICAVSFNGVITIGFPMDSNIMSSK